MIHGVQLWILTVSTVFSPNPALGFLIGFSLWVWLLVSFGGVFLDVSIWYLFYVSALVLWDIPTVLLTTQCTIATFPNREEMLLLLLHEQQVPALYYDLLVTVSDSPSQLQWRIWPPKPDVWALGGSVGDWWSQECSWNWSPFAVYFARVRPQKYKPSCRAHLGE